MSAKGSGGRVDATMAYTLTDLAAPHIYIHRTSVYLWGDATDGHFPDHVHPNTIGPSGNQGAWHADGGISNTAEVLVKTTAPCRTRRCDGSTCRRTCSTSSWSPTRTAAATS